MKAYFCLGKLRLPSTAKVSRRVLWHEYDKNWTWTIFDLRYTNVHCTICTLGQYAGFSQIRSHIMVLPNVRYYKWICKFVGLPAIEYFLITLVGVYWWLIPYIWLLEPMGNSLMGDIKVLQWNTTGVSGMLHTVHWMKIVFPQLPQECVMFSFI